MNMYACARTRIASTDALSTRIHPETHHLRRMRSSPKIKCTAKIDKPECKKCTKALQELENIDDEADQLDIGFVKIHDESLADEYNLGTLPALVYYRHQIPILYEGCIHSHAL